MADNSIVQIVVTPSDSGFGELIAALEQVSNRFLPNTTQAIKLSLKTMEYTWKSYAMGAAIPGSSLKIKSVRGGYAKSIKTRSEGLSGIVYSDSPYAGELEDGAAEKDLKKTLPFGPKSRMGKNGPYIIIPFRHGSPGSKGAPIPGQLYRKIQAAIKRGEFQKSSVKEKVKFTPNAAGELVKRRTYQWGSNVKDTGFPNLEGMVVFEVPSTGREKRSSYVTFRIISANKPKMSKSQKGWENSWVVPAKKGLNLTKYVVANTQEVIADIIRAGIMFDLEG